MVLQYTDAIATIASINFDNLVNFYTNLFGEKPACLIPNVYAEFHLAGLRLGIFQPKKTHESEFEAMSNDKPLCVYAKSRISLCLEVSNLENAIAHLTSLGYAPPGEISIASHGREIYAYDPDGNCLILHQTANNS